MIRLLGMFGAALAAALSPALAQDPTQDDRRILLPRNPSTSPDGRQLAFAWRGDVWLSATAGGEARRLTTHPADDDNPVFHPDGERIAFSSDRAGGRQIFMMTLPDGAPEQITNDSLGKSLIGFTRDGRDMLVSMTSDRHFARGESRRVYLVDLEGERGKRMLFDAGVADAALSPDGTKVLFTRGRASWWRKGFHGASAAQMWLADLSSEPATLTRVSNDRDGFQNISETSPMWAPDGQGYYYVSDPDGTFDVYYRALGSADVRRVTNVAAADGSDDGVAFPTLSMNGETLVVRRLFDLMKVDLSGRAGSNTTPIALRAAGDRLAGPIERRSETSAAAVAFTRDGKQMALVAGEDVYVMDRVLREPVRVTRTPSRETDLVFSADGKTLWFVSDAAGEMDIWSVGCPREDGVWWLGDSFEPKQVTNDRAVESGLKLGPNGKQLAYTRDNDLWLMNVDGSAPRMVVDTWSGADYDWSPDGKWFCYATQDDDYNNDVWIVPADGSRAPFNLSRHPKSDGSPRWSPDGTRIAFTGTRENGESDIFYVNLKKQVEEQTDRDRKLEEALAAMKKDAKKSPSRGRGGRGRPGETEQGEADKPEDDKADKKADEPVVVEIDFDGILDRIHRYSLPDSRESGLIFSPDGKKLMFSGTVDNERALYSIEFPKIERPKKIARSGLSQAVWLADPNEIVGLASTSSPEPGPGPRGPRRFRGFRGSAGGVPASMSTSGKIERFEFSAREERDWTKLRQLAFDQGWRAMRDRFYDPAMNNRDWDAVRAKYRPVAAACLGRAEFNDLMNMMLGELNASHMGHSGGNEPLPRPGSQPAWSPTTYHLGLRFGRPTDAGFPVEGIVQGGPTSQARSSIQAGETLVAVDGQRLTATSDLDAMLTMDQARDVTLLVSSADGKEREVEVRPVASVAGLLYDEWVENTRRKVDELSDGRLGYLHIRGMNMTSLHQMEEDVFHAGHDKDGLIIDVRFNGGGSTADHVMTILTQPVHAVTQSRGSGEGYPQSRKVYPSWGKPIVLMCNQNSFSNAEILSHAVKQTGRGRVVGMRTGGGVISTGSVSLADGSRVRMPGRGWYLVSTGEDMELNGCLPDIALWNRPDGPDDQLARAVQALAEDVAAAKAEGGVQIEPAAAKRKKARAAMPPGGNGGGRR